MPNSLRVFWKYFPENSRASSLPSCTSWSAGWYPAGVPSKKASGKSPLYDVNAVRKLPSSPPRKITNENPRAAKLKSRICAFSLPKSWWSQTGSNRRPPACKAGALPTELWPLDAVIQSLSSDCRRQRMVGLGRLELPTSRLSGVRSNHLSYRPETKACVRSYPRRKRNEDGGNPAL